VLDALNDLLADTQNIVYVMSGRTPEALASDFRTVPQVGLIAENGCFVREFGHETKPWTEFADKEAMTDWKSAVRGILKYYQERLEHSFIEERHCSMFFRFNRVEDKEASTRTAGECSDHINGACSEMGIRAVPIANAVLIETVDQSKAKAAETVLCNQRTAFESEDTAPTDFLMVAGDDREDEIIFRWANELAKANTVANVCTVSVGKRNTEAASTLTQGTTGLLSVLGRLAKISNENAPMDYFNNKTKA
jgi:trehalose-phosphatase